MPSPASVTSSEDSPADTSGSGTPVIGSTPITAPMFTTACTAIQAVMAVAASWQNRSGTRRATRSPANVRPPYNVITHSVPTRPSCSPIRAKMKSDVDSGTQNHLQPPAPRPTPKMPPEPVHCRPWMACICGPVELPPAWRKPVSRSKRYGAETIMSSMASVIRISRPA
jgi:hypothetical protein